MEPAARPYDGGVAQPPPTLGPTWAKVRAQRLARAGLQLPTLPIRSIEVKGLSRTFAVAPAAERAPLLVVLHGAGGTGLGVAALTGLAQRAPSAGIAAVFADGWGHGWNDGREAPRLQRRQGVDDVAFIQALVDRLVTEGVADGDRVFAVGMSNGSFMAEHLARHALLPLTGIVLVAGGAAFASRQARPVPARPAAMLAFHGTADPLVPYPGGPIGPLGQLVGRRSSRRDELAGRGSAAPIEEVASDWAAVDGALDPPVSERLAPPPGDLAVTRLRWRTSGPDVVLYRVEGGGHTWPGGAPYLPERFIGPVARHLDATGVLLDFVRNMP